MTVPVYIAEAAPSHLRGRLVTINTLFITGGQFFAAVVDGAFSYLPRDGWRLLPFIYIPTSDRDHNYLCDWKKSE
ncbi:hypothetical protein FKM82_012790 [Ascaphus truei]